MGGQSTKKVTARQTQAAEQNSCAPIRQAGKAQGKMYGKKVSSETEVVKGLITQNRRALLLKAGACVLLTAAAVALVASGVAAIYAPTILIYPAPSKAFAYACIAGGGVIAPVSTYAAVQFIKDYLKARQWNPQAIIGAGQAAHRTPVTAKNFQKVVHSLEVHQGRVAAQNSDSDNEGQTGI